MSIPTPAGFREGSKKCTTCLAYQSCRHSADSASVSLGTQPKKNVGTGFFVEAVCALKSLRPWVTLGGFGLVVSGVATITALSLMKDKPEEGKVGAFLALERVDVRVAGEDDVSSSQKFSKKNISNSQQQQQQQQQQIQQQEDQGNSSFSSESWMSSLSRILVPSRDVPWSSMGGAVVVRREVVNEIRDLIRKEEGGDLDATRALAVERAKLSHEAGHVRHHDSWRMAGTICSVFSLTYLAGYAILSPATRRFCSRYPIRSSLPFIGVHGALLGISLYTSRKVGFIVARELETMADDNITDESALMAMIGELSEERLRAEDYMRSIGAFSPEQQRSIYLYEDPSHPPIPDRIARMSARLKILQETSQKAKGNNKLQS